MTTVMVRTGEPGEPVASAERARDLSGEAYRVLAYNQELVQFADSKAGTLILVNSLFVAAAASSGAALWTRLLDGACVAAAAVAVVACLAVVMASAPPATTAPADLLFFDDIRRRRHVSSYVSDFLCCPDEEVVEQLLRRAYAAAGIAQRKFRAYGVARVATAASAAFWLVAHAARLFA